VMSRKILVTYYAATALFLLLDYGFGINVRVVFLDAAPGLRAGFYGILFTCLALMLWRPNWMTVIVAVESLVTLVALIINMALRSMIVTDAMLETGTGFVTVPEIFNFMLVGGAAYISYMRGIKALAGASDSRH